MNSDSPGFIARAARFAVRVPVTLHSSDGPIKGRMIDLSESGMFAVFDRSLDVWLSGRVSAVIGEWQLNLNARVVRVEGRRAGLAFHGLADADRAVLHSVVQELNSDASQRIST